MNNDLKLNSIYKTNLVLLTDLYQLTMAYGYWKNKRENQKTVFNLFFRKNPFKGGYAVSCGLAYVIDYLKNFKFTIEDIEYLKILKGNNEKPLFENKFLRYLMDMNFECDIDAIEEGKIVFPEEPLIRVKGPIIQCQLIETALLNIINFQTLIATKASRICYAAKGEPILEFGLRRAQGIDGALTASRAAYIGGCASTSNVLAGKIFGIPVKGTHAHSWVMSYETELESFKKYAKTMPNNCVFLVDTYDTIAGVKNAVKTGLDLQKSGYEMVGIRLDSGDMAELSIKARKLLDKAGFTKTVIIASNDLNEESILQLKKSKAAINVWGVGTKLVTAYGQPALGGVYKLSAIEKAGGGWLDKMKLSEEAIKTTNPGIQQVRRFYKNGYFDGDTIYDIRESLKTPIKSIDKVNPKKFYNYNQDTPSEDLLIPIIKKGKQIYSNPDLKTIRNKLIKDLEKLPGKNKKLDNPENYFVGLSEYLFNKKAKLIQERKNNEAT